MQNKGFYTTMAVLFIGTVSVISVIYVAQPILPVLSKAFSVPPSKAALAVSINILALAVALLIMGPISDYVGRKTVMVWSALLLSLPTLLIAFTEDFDLFLFFRAMQGIFSAGISAIAIAYITEEFEPKVKAKAIGIYVSAMITSGLFGRLGGGMMTALLGYKGMFIVFSALNLIGGLLLWRYLPTSMHFRANPNISVSMRGMVRHFKNPYLIGAFMIAFCLFFTYTGSFTFMTFYLSNPPFNLNTFELSLVFLVYISGVASPIAGTLSFRYGRQPVIYAGLVTALFGLVLTLLGQLALVIAGMFFLCLGLFITQPSASALVGDKAGSNYGSASSLYLFFYYFGGSIGAIAPAPMWYLWGWAGVVLVCVGLLFVAILALSTLCRR